MCMPQGQTLCALCLTATRSICPRARGCRRPCVACRRRPCSRSRRRRPSGCVLRSKSHSAGVVGDLLQHLRRLGLYLSCDCTTKADGNALCRADHRRLCWDEIRRQHANLVTEERELWGETQDSKHSSTVWNPSHQRLPAGASNSTSSKSCTPVQRANSLWPGSCWRDFVNHVRLSKVLARTNYIHFLYDGNTLEYCSTPK